MAQLENREQTRLDLVRFDPATGKSRLLLSETSASGSTCTICSSRSSAAASCGPPSAAVFAICICAMTTARCAPVDQGEWMVDDLAGVDEESQFVYFTATLDSPLERHFYVVPLAGGEPERITRAPGMHAVTLDHGCRRFVDVHEP